MDLATAFVMVFLAVIIGGWRQLNEITSMHDPYGVARIWRNLFVRYFSWVIVVGCSLYASYVFSIYIESFFGELVGKFSIGAALYSRWFASMLLCYRMMPQSQKDEIILQQEKK